MMYRNRQKKICLISFFFLGGGGGGGSGEDHSTVEKKIMFMALELTFLNHIKPVPWIFITAKDGCCKI